MELLRDFLARFHRRPSKVKVRAVYLGFPTSIPVVLRRAPDSRLKPLKKRMFLIPHDLTVRQLAFVVQTSLSLDPKTHVYLYVNPKEPLEEEGVLVEPLYKLHKDNDQFIYMTYSEVDPLSVIGEDEDSN